MENSDARIARNTLYLYARMVVTIALGLLTTRIVLSLLGISDYGVYSVVAGVTSLFTLFNSVLQSGSRRFMAYSQGIGDEQYSGRTFSTALSLHCILALAVLILLETCGLWILNKELNIDSSRMNSANVVFQFSVIGVLLSIVQTPFVAAVTAHEKFNVYAILSLVDVFGKIILLVFLYIIPGDKLIVYAGTILAMSLVTTLVYIAYCIRTFPECNFTLIVDSKLFREMLHFSGWTILGHLSAVANSHGTSIILNVFFNTAINAARGVASSVLFIIGQLAQGFITAAEPQLVKFHAANETKKFTSLIFNISQCSLVLLSVISVPVLLEMDYVLCLWLDKVPLYTSIFIKITIITYVVKYSFLMIDKSIVAIGKVKLQNIFVTPIYLLNLPAIYIALRFIESPVVAYICSMICTFLGIAVNLYVLQRYVNFNWRRYLFLIFVKGYLLIILASIIPCAIAFFMCEGFLRFIFVCISSVTLNLLVMYRWGISRDAQTMIRERIKEKISFVYEPRS